MTVSASFSAPQHGIIPAMTGLKSADPSKLPTHDEVRTWLNYDPATGILTWRDHPRPAHCVPGTLAGTKKGYPKHHPTIRVGLNGQRYDAARIAWFYMTGKWPVEVDHKNTNSMDNRWENLREATRTQNNRNIGLRSSNRTGFKGVSFSKLQGRYMAAIRRPSDGKQQYLGYFDTAEEAHAAYAKAALAYHGEFVRLA